MAANTVLNVTGLDFSTIRDNLKTFIAAKPEFADYDFSDSAIGTLLDLLAYNTYYSAIYSSIAASEAHLDSAQLFDSVVSRAKLVGYTPRSARGATANVQITFTTAVANATFNSITVAKNTSFRATINGVAYTFVTPKNYVISSNSSSGFRSYIDLVEGYPLTYRFTFSSSNTGIVLPNANVDTRSIAVTAPVGGVSATFNLADDITTVNSSSKVFYIDGERDSKFKVYFGDGVLGQQPDQNGTVSVSYRVCSASKGNGANNFTALSSVGGQSNFTLRCISRASGGAGIESIGSIKFNAPKAYETQNRAVVAEDYKRLILRDNRDIRSVNIWGGEENDPPIYGKVYGCVKPVDGNYISTNRKEEIKSTIKKYLVQSIDLELIDPTYMFIVPNITVQYDASLTTYSASEIASLIADRIITYETNNLNSFDGSFWFSKFLKYIDLTDDSIVGTTAFIDLQKRFIPSTSTKNTYEVHFNNELEKLGDWNAANLSGSASMRHPGFGFISSTAFSTPEHATSYLEDNGFGVLRIFYKDASGSFGKIYTNYDTGTVNYETGEVTIDEFLPTNVANGGTISINARPRSYNITPVRNQILLFSGSKITVEDYNSKSVLAKLGTVETLGNSVSITSSLTNINNGF